MSAPSPTDHTDYTHHRGVRHTKSGKWGAAIRHPITKVSVWLGSYNTPKEAADAYIKKKLEFNSTVADVAIRRPEKALARKSCEAEEALSRKSCEAKVMDQAEIKREESHVHTTENVKAPSAGTRSVNSSDASNHVRRPPGSGSVYQNKAGRWTAYIRIRKVKVYVGTFTTYEEAEAALRKRKQQDLDSTSPVEAAVVKESDPECGSKRTRKPKKPLSESVDGQVICNRPRGVYQRESGRWFAEITNPVTKVRHSVGTYETAQEALEALDRKRREYAEMKKRKQSHAETEPVSECPDIVLEAGISKVEDADPNGDRGGGSQVGSNLVPRSSFVSNQDDEFDTSSVINAYGELVGEFSRMDDELWFG